MPMVVSTKECGRKIFDMEKGLSATPIAIRIMDISKWGKLMEKAFTPGLMVKFTMVSGFRD